MLVVLSRQNAGTGSLLLEVREVWLLVVMLLAYFGVFCFAGPLVRKITTSDSPVKDASKVVSIDHGMQLPATRRP
jgi:hypothetical protein